MVISSIKELDRLMKLCRKNGVSAIEIDNIKFNLGPEPITQEPRQILGSPIVTGSFDPGQIVTDELTEEQKLFGSSDPTVWAQN
jgi:hypothetical protein